MREIRIDQSYTNIVEESLNRYLGEIKSIAMITAEEEVNLAKMIKTGDQAALQKLVRANLRFVISVAKKYQGQGLPLSDLINDGNLGLMAAAAKFDETRGFKFISYAVWWIRQGIMTALSENTRMIRLPMNQILAGQKIRSYQSILEQQLEREPSYEEIAAAADLHETAVIDHIFRNMTTKSLNEKLSPDTDLDLSSSLMDPNLQPTDEKMSYESMQKDISRLLSVLQERELKIICELYGLEGTAAISMDLVAKKNNLSRERVRQLLHGSIKKMKSHASARLTEHFQH